MNNKTTRDIISFAAGGSYDAIINTGIHAHPANKRGYPDKYTPFLLFRKKGGIMECVFRVKKTYDLIPSRLLTFPDDLTPKEKECLHKYLAFRRTEYAQRMKIPGGFKYMDQPYRFYFLERYSTLNPPLIVKNKYSAGIVYYSYDEVGIKDPTSAD